MVATIVIVAILVVAVIVGVRSFKQRASGGCCGGGGGTIAPKEKKLDKPVVREVTMYIDGMTCENCENRVTRALDRIDGVTADVDHKRGVADVKMDRDVADKDLVYAVERLDYKVTSIEVA